MKNKSTLTLLIIFALFLLQGCTNDGIEESPIISFENSSLEVKVRVITDTGIINAIGADVKLYDTKDDRIDGYEEVYTGKTNVEGKCTFTSMAKPEYWISVESPIDGQVKFFNEDSPYRTPGHPIILNKLDVLFEK